MDNATDEQGKEEKVRTISPRRDSSKRGEDVADVFRGTELDLLRD